MRKTERSRLKIFQSSLIYRDDGWPAWTPPC